MISFSRIRAMIYRYALSWNRELEELLEAFWWPSFDILLWGFMTVYLQKQSGAASTVTGFIVGAIIFWMFVYRSQQEIAVLFLREYWNHNFLNIFTSPITITEYLLSTIIVGVFKLLISAAWMSLLSYLLFHFSIFSFGWYFIPLVLNLLLVGWWAGFLIMGLVIQYGYRVQAFAWSLIVIIQPFSGVMYPVSVLPQWMQSVSYILPTRYIFENMRLVLLTGSIDWIGVGIATALNALYIIIALLFLRYGFAQARKTGMIIKFS